MNLFSNIWHTVWICKICHTLPDMLNDMPKELAEVAKTNANLFTDFKAKVKQNDILRKENEELRSLVYKPATKIKTNSKHLIVADHSLQHGVSNRRDV